MTSSWSPPTPMSLGSAGSYSPGASSPETPLSFYSSSPDNCYLSAKMDPSLEDDHIITLVDSLLYDTQDTGERRAASPKQQSPTPPGPTDPASPNNNEYIDISDLNYLDMDAAWDKDKQENNEAPPKVISSHLNQQEELKGLTVDIGSPAHNMDGNLSSLMPLSSNHMYQQQGSEHRALQDSQAEEDYKSPDLTASSPSRSPPSYDEHLQLRRSSTEFKMENSPPPCSYAGSEAFVGSCYSSDAGLFDYRGTESYGQGQGSYNGE